MVENQSPASMACLTQRQHPASQGVKILVELNKVQNRTKCPIPLGDQEVMGEKPSLVNPRLHLSYGCFLQKSGQHTRLVMVVKLANLVTEVLRENCKW